VIGDRWGMRDDEVARHYPCDDVVPTPVLAAYRAVTVQVTPERVWPWVAQIRLGPYSYDWIDNAGHRSPQELRGLPEPTAGEPFTHAFGRPAGRIVSVTPGTQLTGQISGATMSYILVPDASATRLLLKVVIARGRPLAPLISVGDLVMARRQLLNLKRLAETRCHNS
jgi:hypothetical protein